MLLTYTFFQNALIGALLASVLCAIIGTYVVTRRMVIAGGGMAHASLGGVGLGAYFGFSPLLGAALFATLSGLGIRWISGKRAVREDSAIALLWTLGMALGILFAYLAPGFMTDLPSYLFGDILSISHADLIDHCGIRPSAAYDYQCGLRCKLCPYARHSCYDHRIRYDTAHSSHHRRLPPHGRHRDGHLTTQCAPNDGRPLCPHL